VFVPDLNLQAEDEEQAWTARIRALQCRRRAGALPLRK